MLDKKLEELNKKAAEARQQHEANKLVEKNSNERAKIRADKRDNEGKPKVTAFAREAVTTIKKAIADAGAPYSIDRQFRENSGVAVTAGNWAVTFEKEDMSVMIKTYSIGTFRNMTGPKTIMSSLSNLGANTKEELKFDLLLEEDNITFNWYPVKSQNGMPSVYPSAPTKVKPVTAEEIMVELLDIIIGLPNKPVRS